MTRPPISGQSANTTPAWRARTYVPIRINPNSARVSPATYLANPRCCPVGRYARRSTNAATAVNIAAATSSIAFA